ncbi:MAG: hypothetical protein KJ063_02165 [Anaerolineae bacterium]|nr:hypothetical protein [Anaerolineae bacterium]
MIFGSKKFQVMVVGLVVLALVSLVPELAPLEAHLTEIVAIVVAYIVGQGMADLGKHRQPDSKVVLGSEFYNEPGEDDEDDHPF